jgi:hypothetical protein
MWPNCVEPVTEQFSKFVIEISFEDFPEVCGPEA